MPYLEQTTTMPDAIAALYQQMVSELTLFEIEDIPTIIRAKKSVVIIQKKMEELKAQVSGEDFADQEHEIHFFKDIKPRFHSHLLFNLSAYHFESAMPHGSTEGQCQYLQK